MRETVKIGLLAVIALASAATAWRAWFGDAPVVAVAGCGTYDAPCYVKTNISEAIFIRTSQGDPIEITNARSSSEILAGHEFPLKVEISR